jgi:hypothetical protein
MTIVLEKGKHASPEEGMCLMEAVAFIAGEDFSDEPKCVSPMLAEFGRALNDFLLDDARQQLTPLIPKLIGTVNPEQDQRDGLRCAHWVITHWLPTWLDLVPELEKHSTALRELPKPKTWADVRSWNATVSAAENATWIEAKAETKDDVTRKVAWAASRDTAGNVAWAAWWNTLIAVGSIDTELLHLARSAAWGAAIATNVGTLLPTVIQLEQDSIALFTELVEGRQ